MRSSRSVRSLLPVFLQCLLGVAGVGTLWVSPPAQGQMQLVPLAGQSRAELVNYAVAEGFTIVATGGIPGSLVVRGERGRLGWPLFGHGILVLASGSGSCAPA